MDESLGEAFVRVNADTSAFKAQLEAGVGKAIAATEKATRASATRTAAAQAKAAESAANAEQAARQKAQAAISRLYTQDIKNSQAAATAATKAAQTAARAQIAADDEFLAAHNAVMAEAAAVSKASYSEAAAAAAAAGRAERAELSATTAAAKIAATEQAAVAKATATAQKASFAGGFASGTKGLSLAGFGKSLGSFSASIPADIFGAITTSAKFATIGVLGLGAALAAIGIENAAKQQAALVGFTALADQISATTDKVTGLNVATQDLDQSERKAIGNGFLQQLIQLANNSALSQSALQDTTQQLLALGFNGDQAIGIVKDVGNALAASGKSGGQLNEDLKGIITAFAQIKGSGRLLAQDLNQITTRIPAATRVKVYQQLAQDLKLAGASAKDGTPQFAAMTKNVQKLAKEGLIPADTAIASITQVLEKVPGAAKDAATGLDALGRQNETLAGRFEALKDNVRTALARAFLLPGEPGGPGGGKSLADRLADQLGAFIPVITNTIAKIGPPLAGFVSKFAGVLIENLPKLIDFVGQAFDGFSKFLDLATTKGNPVNDLLVGLKNTFEGLLPILGLAFDLLLPGLAALGPLVRIFGDVVKILGDVAGAVRKVLKPITLLTTGAVYLGVKLLSEAFDLAAQAVSHLGDAADYVQKKFIGAIDFVLVQVEHLIKALDFHVGPIHIQVPGADAAISKIEDLRGQLNAIPSSVTTAVNIITNKVDANGGIIQGGLLNGQTVHDSESARAAGLRASQKNTTGADLAANAAKHFSTGGGAGGAASGAKAAADKIKAAFADLAGDLKAIGDKTSEQSADTIKTNFDKLIKDLIDSGHKALVKGTKKTEDQLIKDANKLKALQEKLAAELNIAGSIKSGVIDSANATQTSGIGSTFFGIKNKLSHVVQQTKAFTVLIKKLQAEHLNRNTIKQLVEAGPEAGFAAAQALVGAGQIGVDQINSLNTELVSAANDLANDTAGELYKAGQHAADGLLDGLKSKETELEGAMNHLADVMVARIKKALKIASPSKVFAALGSTLPEGLARGATGNLAPIQRASTAMAVSTTNAFGPGSIVVNSANPNNPQGTGTMVGHGIIGVLERQKTQAALMGFGG